MEYTFGHLKTAVLALFPPSFLYNPSVLTGEAVVRHRKGLGSMQALLTKLKYSCVINSVFSPNPKRSPILTIVNQINATPAKPSTFCTADSLPFTSWPGPTLSNTSSLTLPPSFTHTL